ncbi:hypothetical protein ACFOSC_32065 [Streptantibioticus rubrisoli]|uniref:Uncharacterized protein n=1 Tax=Streptantibioticus rubrisoli TaxID=1387313 RepID=A0ABT1P901_9ACTN|nr:hypothetical protein [Streptantibioticus rubrisoli]MCQ4041847.1 hypothetical protein [Streptantibioticus rubrisoli]
MATAVLGFQRALDARSGDQLARLNSRLARAISLRPPAGLLDYRVLRSRAAPERFCAYWLWRDWSWRERLFADPPPSLRRFADEARGLWAHDPDVGRYTWRGRPPRSACQRGDVVLLSPGDGPGNVLVEQHGERRFRWSVQVGTVRPGDGADAWCAL